MAFAKPRTRYTINNTTRIQKEQPLTCARAIPSYEDITEVPKLHANPHPLADPQLNTLLRQKDEIEKIETLKSRRFTTAEALTPRTKTTIMPKINQRLNFDVTRPVFKNLTPINVNDSLMLSQEKASIRKKYNPHKRNKPPAPDLADFLDPIKPLTHVIPLPGVALQFPKLAYEPLKIYEQFADNSLLAESIPNSGIK